MARKNRAPWKNTKNFKHVKVLTCASLHASLKNTNRSEPDGGFPSLRDKPRTQFFDVETGHLEISTAEISTSFLN